MTIAKPLADAIDKVLAEGLEKHYKVYNIKKRTRGYRTICAPSKELKAIQRELLNSIEPYSGNWNLFNSYGFIKGKTIAGNALHHRTIHPNTYSSVYRVRCMNRTRRFWKPYVLDGLRSFVPDSIIRMDLQNAFGTVTEHMVRKKMIKHFNLEDDDLERFIKIACYNGTLPQGGPLSPTLLNMVLKDFDVLLMRVITKVILNRFKCNVKYSRFADDIILSSVEPNIVTKCIKIVDAVARYFGFKIKRRKTKLMTAKHGMFITGINIVNAATHISISKAQRNKVRAAIYEASKETDQKKRHKLKLSVIGRVSYVDSLDKVHGTILAMYAVKVGLFTEDQMINKISIKHKSEKIDTLKLERKELYSNKKTL